MQHSYAGPQIARQISGCDHIDGAPGDEALHHPADDEPSPNATLAEEAIHESFPEKRQRRVPSSRSQDWQDPATRLWKDDIVTFDSKTDPQNPKNWTVHRKRVITILFGLTTMCSTFASSVFSPAIPYISAEYGISTLVATLGISLFISGYIVGPVLWPQLSELLGRKASVVLPMICFTCFVAATGASQGVASIMITRFFAGVFAAAPVTNVGGGIADMYNQKDRGTAVVFYSLAVVSGPLLGPIIGSAVSQSHLGWRWTQWLSVILSSVIIGLDILLLPETFAPLLLSRKAKKLRIKTKRWALHGAQEEKELSLRIFIHKQLTLPIMLLVKEPMILCICLFNSFTYGVLYLLFACIPIIFEENRGWGPLVGSLPFIAVLLGSFTAAAINFSYSQYVFAPRVEASQGKGVAPELRLIPMMIGSVAFPIGFFLLGWTSKPSIHWFPSFVGLFFIGMSFLLIFQAGINFLLDGWTKVSASAVASNTFLRSIFAAGLPLVAQPMFHNLGINWACTLLGCIAVLLASVPFVFYRFGPKLRAMSNFTTNL